MTNQTIPPCPECGNQPTINANGIPTCCENGVFLYSNPLADAWTEHCHRLLGRACRELGIETVEQLKAKVQPDPRVALLDELGLHSTDDVRSVVGKAVAYNRQTPDPRVAVLEKKLAKLTYKLEMVEQESDQRLSAIISYSDQLLAMKEKYEPASQSEPHPDGCFSQDPNDVQDCETDGHYSCKDCKRNSRIAAQRGEGG